jgi:hypothetical protein
MSKSFLKHPLATSPAKFSESKIGMYLLFDFLEFTEQTDKLAELKKLLENELMPEAYVLALMQNEFSIADYVGVVWQRWDVITARMQDELGITEENSFQVIAQRIQDVTSSNTPNVSTAVIELDKKVRKFRDSGAHGLQDGLKHIHTSSDLNNHYESHTLSKLIDSFLETSTDEDGDNIIVESYDESRAHVYFFLVSMLLVAPQISFSATSLDAYGNKINLENAWSIFVVLYESFKEIAKSAAEDQPALFNIGKENEYA